MESEKKQTKRKYEKKNMSVAATVHTTLAVGRVTIAKGPKTSGRALHSDTRGKDT